MELSTEERTSLIKDYFTKGLNQKRYLSLSVNLSFIFFICIEMLAMSVANGVKFPFSIASPVSCAEFYQKKTGNVLIIGSSITKDINTKTLKENVTVNTKRW
jgi:hypothetical protein